MRILLTALLALSLACGTLLIRYSWKRQSQPGARYLILLAAAIMAVNAGYIGELNSGDIQTALIWSGIEHLALPWNPYFWLMMCLDYTHTCKHFRRVRNLMLIFPLLYYFVFYTNPLLHLYITQYYFRSNGYFSVLYSVKGPGFLMLMGMITVIGAACCAMFIHGYLRSAQVFRNSYLLMLFASILPWLAVYLNINNSGYLGIDYYSFLMVITGALYLFGIFHYNFFSSIPIAAETVYRLSEDAIALADITGRVMDVNDALLKAYPEMKLLSKKLMLSDFLKNHPEFTGLSPQNPEVSFPMLRGGKRRYFQTKLTPIFSENGVSIGTIFSIKDITVYAEHQNQLKLLAENAIRQAETNEISYLQAQISPHFINNTLSIISSMITRDDEKAKELVVDLSEYLISCYRAGNSSPMAALSQELDAVQTYMRIIKARFGDRIRFSSETEELPGLELPRLVLQPLVENAVRHGVQPKKDGGTVKLEIKAEGAFAVVTVQDDGVGIQPERIESLLHGSDDKQGVGIINIQKRLLKHYGEGLTIRSGGGTAVSFRIPLMAKKAGAKQ